MGNSIKRFYILFGIVLILSLVMITSVSANVNLTDGLVSYWKFDETSGTTASDSHGTNDGTVSGATWTTGKLNNGLDLDGTNDYVRISDNNNLDFSNEMSLFFWIKRDGAPSINGNTVISKYDYGNNNRLWQIDHKTDVLRFVFGTGSVIKKVYDIPYTSINTVNNNFHYIGFTFNYGSLKIYINGNEITPTKTQDNEMISLYNSEKDILIGANFKSGIISNFNNIIIDEIGVWSRALTSDEVSELYNSGNALNYDDFEDKQILNTPQVEGNTITISDVIYYNGIINISSEYEGFENISCEYTINNGTNWLSADNNSTHCYKNNLEPNTDIDIRFRAQEDGEGNYTQSSLVELTYFENSKITFNAYDIFDNEITTFNVTIGTITKNDSEEWNLNEGTYTATFSKTNWFNNTLTFNVTEFDIKNYNFTNLYQSIVTFEAFEIITNNKLDNFNVTIGTETKNFLLTDSFETGFDGWDYNNGVTISTDWSSKGSYSLKVSSSISDFGIGINNIIYKTINVTNINNIYYDINIFNLDSSIIVKINDDIIKTYNSLGEYLNENLDVSLYSNNINLSIIVQGTAVQINNFYIDNIRYNIFNLIEDNYIATFSKNGYYDINLSFNTTPLEIETLNFIDVYDNILNITIQDKFNSSLVNNITGELTYNGFTFNINSSNHIFNLKKDLNYSVDVVANNYARFTNTTYLINETYQNLIIELYPRPSIMDLEVRDIDTGDLITDQINITITKTDYSNTLTTTNGTYYIDDLSIGIYTLVFFTSNYSLTYKVQNVATSDSYQKIIVYLEKGTEQVIFIIRDRETKNIIENALIKMKGVITGQNNFVEITSVRTNINGRATLTYVKLKNYCFEISKGGYETREFCLNPIDSDSYGVELTPLLSAIDVPSDFSNILVNFKPNQFRELSTNPFIINFYSPTGIFNSYYINIIYPNGTFNYNGNNPEGESISHNIILSEVNWGDVVKIQYGYNTTIEARDFSFTYRIIKDSTSSTWFKNKDINYNMGVLEKTTIVTSSVLLIAGTATYMAGALVGGGIGLIMLIFFSYIGLISSYALYITLIVGIMMILYNLTRA